MTKKAEAKPRERRRGWLKNDNPPGDLSTVARCGAKTRKGTPCLCPAMKNGRCRLHGGKSTGPKTPEGRKRIGQAHLKHGGCTKEALASRDQFFKLLRKLRASLAEIHDMPNTTSIRMPDLHKKM